MPPRLGLPGVREPPLVSFRLQTPPRCAMFKKLKQKISEEQQQLQQALASTQVRMAASARPPLTEPEGGEGEVVLP